MIIAYAVFFQILPSPTPFLRSIPFATHLLLLLTVVLGNEVKGHSVQCAGHHTKHRTEDQGRVDIREESYESCSQAEEEISNEIKAL